MNGMLLDETGDLMISLRRNGLGEIGSGLQVAACEDQILERILVANRGEFKEVPLIGGELDRMINGEANVFWTGRLKDMFTAMLIRTGRIAIDETGIHVEMINT